MFKKKSVNLVDPAVNQGHITNIRAAELRKIKKTNHLLHFILTLLTFSLWLLVWFFLALNRALNARKISAAADYLCTYLAQGVSYSYLRSEHKSKFRILGL